MTYYRFKCITISKAITGQERQLLKQVITVFPENEL